MGRTHWIGRAPATSSSLSQRCRSPIPSVVARGLAVGLLALVVGGCGALNGSAQATTSLSTSAAITTTPSASATSATPTPTATPSLMPTITAAVGTQPVGRTAEPSAVDHFSLTGAMTTARVRHTATLLRDGRVLIVGGSAGGWGSASLKSAEIYNPTTGKFSATGSMQIARAGHTATLLNDGRVLVAGGHSADLVGLWLNPKSTAPDMGLPLGSAEIYDPATGKFTSTGSMIAARDSHTATLLHDGRVLIAGGFDCTNVTSCEGVGSAELYDPATGHFSLTGSPQEFVDATAAVLLNDGHVLVVGNSEMGIFDPATGKFSGSAEPPLTYGPVSLLKNGRVLRSGGLQSTPGGSPGYALFAAAELFDPATGKFSPTGSMAKARAGHSSTALSDGRVLVAGGGDIFRCRANPCTSADLGTAEIYDPATGRFSPAQSMKVGRFDHTSTLLKDGRVLITGGRGGTVNGQAVASAELYGR